MTLTFLGAAGEVTGSCYLIETRDARLLIDCGLHQGGPNAEARNWRPLPFDPASLSAVLVTHAHIDHTGRLPLLAKHGFDGPIWSTLGTRDLANILLKDAAHLQEMDAERRCRHRARVGRQACAPLYTQSDAARSLAAFRLLPLGTPSEIAPGITARLVDAGHILGSASVELTVHDGARTRTVAFSGDLGPDGAPMLHDPTHLSRADLVVMESTYGDRDHRPLKETVAEFAAILREAIDARAKVLIPAFAIGRTQQLLYHLRELRESGALPAIPVYVDSPMAHDATELYERHQKSFDDSSLRITARGHSPIDFPDLHFAETSEQSRALNDRRGPLIIIAASGMCTGGRIVHHLRHSLGRPETHVVIVGFQSEGSLGRRLVNREPRVRIMGEEIDVKARIHTLGGFSAHAGRSELIHWASHFKDGKPRFCLTHGEQAPRRALATALRDAFAFDIVLPEYHNSVEI